MTSEGPLEFFEASKIHFGPKIAKTSQSIVRYLARLGVHHSSSVSVLFESMNYSGILVCFNSEGVSATLKKLPA